MSLYQGRSASAFRFAFAVFTFCALFSLLARAQSLGNSSSITGTVTDPQGAVIPGATVEIHNPVSELDRTVTTDKAGRFSFPNVPLNPYHLVVSAPSFASQAQDVELRSSVPREPHHQAGGGHRVQHRHRPGRCRRLAGK